MNVRITAHYAPNRTHLFSDVVGPVRCDGKWLELTHAKKTTSIPVGDVAEIALDEEGAWPE